MKKMVNDEYEGKKGSNREIDSYPKLMAGVMMLASGGQRVEDIEVLRADRGLLESLGWDEMICADTLLNDLAKRRRNAKNRQINEALVVKALQETTEEELTYDHDATYIDSGKKSAEYSYQGRKQFSAMIGCFAELGLIGTVEYRRGNESPQVGILNQLRKANAQVKRAGKRIKRFRSDSAAHQDAIFTYCDMDGIEYYVTMDKNEGVMKVIRRQEAPDWKTMYGRYKEQYETQWAEAKYVVSKGYKVRILILRWLNPDPDLFDESPYCYHVIATNNWEVDAMDWLERHNGRMGTIEQLHKEIKTGYGCEYTPSHEFEKNRGYFLLGVLAHNMVQIMKLFYLGAEAIKWTVKTMRYRFINVCGKIVKSGRRFTCYIINVTDEIFELFRYCKSRLAIPCC